MSFGEVCRLTPLSSKEQNHVIYHNLAQYTSPWKFPQDERVTNVERLTCAELGLGLDLIPSELLLLCC